MSKIVDFSETRGGRLAAKCRDILAPCINAMRVEGADNKQIAGILRLLALDIERSNQTS